MPYYGAHNTTKRYKEQIYWCDKIKGKVWQKIIQKKIEEQAQHLFDKGFVEQADLCEILENYNEIY